MQQHEQEYHCALKVPLVVRLGTPPEIALVCSIEQQQTQWPAAT
jgi:hypothetical protein